ncbi:MAG: serine hydrolase [Acidimicrobiales bacterium]
MIGVALVLSLVWTAPALAQDSGTGDTDGAQPTSRAARAFPAQLGCVEWPTDAWPRSRLPAGVARSDINEVVNDFRRRGGRSVVIIHGGRLVYEWYRGDITPETVNHSFSVSKSITATMAGILHREGLISDVEAPVPVPEWQTPGDPRAAITWHNLMSMRTGLEWNESYDFGTESDNVAALISGDAGGYAAAKPLVAEPGTSSNYSTGTTHLLARSMGQVLGATGEAMEAEVRQRLFDPLGIGTVEMGFDQSGYWLGGALTDMTTRDFARYGLLHLRGGEWDGEQLLPHNWVHRRGADGHDTHFWAGPTDRFGGFGIFGQSVKIAADLDLVVAANSDNGGFYNELIEELFVDAQRPSCGRDATFGRPLDDPGRIYRPGRSIMVRFSVEGGPPAYGTGATVVSRRVHCRYGYSLKPDVPVPGRVRQRADGQYRIEWPTRPGWRGCRQLQVMLPDGSAHIATVRFPPHRR